MTSLQIIFHSLTVFLLLWRTVVEGNDDEAPSSSANEYKEFVRREISVDVTESIRSRGYDVKRYDIITVDGYILRLHRIVNPLIKKEDTTSLKPVILMHGLFGSPADWIPQDDWIASPEGLRPQLFDEVKLEDISSLSNKFSSSLGFTLANYKFDVWLATMRGSAYGQRHIFLSDTKPDFWQFSLDEHIAYDLPTIIMFVEEATKQAKIGYVGHSHGSLMAFGLLSTRQKYAKILEPVIALAPVAYVIPRPPFMVPDFRSSTQKMRDLSMGALTTSIALKYLKNLICPARAIIERECKDLLYTIFGPNGRKVKEKSIREYITFMPPGTSIKTLAHYGQAAVTRRFAHLDYGRSGNLFIYGSVESPIYDLKKIRSHHIHLFYSKNDCYAGIAETELLKKDLQVPYHETNMSKEYRDGFGHFDYIYSTLASREINKRVLAALTN